MFHVFSLYALILAVYLCASLIVPLPLAKRWKALFCTPVLLAALKNEVLYFFGGPMFFAPELPGWFLIALSIAFNILLMLFFLTLLKDLVLTALWIINRFRGGKVPFFRRPAAVSAGIAVLASFLGVWGTVNALPVPEVREETLAVPALPDGLNGLRVAILADIHCSAVNREAYVREVTARTNALKPDLILLLGDLVDGTPEQRERDLLPLKALKAEYGIFGVPGNHEYYSGYDNWMKLFRSWGFVMLENSGEELRINGASLYIAGVTNRATRRFRKEEPDAAKALKNCPANAVTFLLDHQPGTAAENAKLPFTVQFSGHTHGGMILGIDRWFIARFNGGFVSGWYDLDDRKLYVSRGTGLWNGFIFRLGVPPEITLLTLKK